MCTHHVTLHTKETGAKISTHTMQFSSDRLQQYIDSLYTLNCFVKNIRNPVTLSAIIYADIRFGTWNGLSQYSIQSGRGINALL